MKRSGAIVSVVETPYPPDSTEYNRDLGLLAVGQYEYVKSTSQRLGKVSFLDIASGSYPERFPTYDLANGVLDMKWMDDTLHAACSGGVVSSFFRDEGGEWKSSVTYESGDADEILLQINTNHPRALLSTTKGRLLEVDMEKQVLSTSIDNAHDLEVWSNGYHSQYEQVLLSGSDDCLFKGWDLREGAARPLFEIRRDAGVTSIASNDRHLLVGSYDEYLYVYDFRMLSKRRPIDEISVGGQVWKLRERGDDLVVAAMQSGFVRYDLHDGFRRAESYSYPDVLGYSVEFVSDDLVAVCSFYDKKLGLWKVA